MPGSSDEAHKGANDKYELDVEGNEKLGDDDRGDEEA